MARSNSGRLPLPHHIGLGLRSCVIVYRTRPSSQMREAISAIVSKTSGVTRLQWRNDTLHAYGKTSMEAPAIRLIKALKPTHILVSLIVQCGTDGWYVTVNPNVPIPPRSATPGWLAYFDSVTTRGSEVTSARLRCDIDADITDPASHIMREIIPGVLEACRMTSPALDGLLSGNRVAPPSAPVPCDQQD